MNLVKCPTCEKKIEWSEKFTFRPFCSERCKLIDLGAWADGTYAIPSKDPIEDSDLLPGESGHDEE